MSREIKFSCMWSDGKSWMNLRYTLDEMCNGDHWEAMADQPMLKKFVLKHIHQYTGLVDKDGVEIYEGDIVKSVSEIIKPFAGRHKEKTGKMSTKYSAIEYRDKSASFCIKGSALPSIGQTVATKYYEVVGNIYENPELVS